MNMGSPPAADAYALVPFKPKSKKEKSVEKPKEKYAAMLKGAKPTAAKKQPRLPAAMQLRVLEASQEDQPIVMEIALILNEMITKIEHGDD
jgi:hypothetical protein